MHFKKLTALLSIAWILGSCTETETIEAPALASNRVMEFKISNLNEPIYGAISEDNLTINIYLPYYYFLSIIQPEIEISEGAIISPASGEYIENIPALINGENDFIYTVTDANGHSVEYQLEIHSDQPELTVDEVSTAEDTLALSQGTIYMYNGAENWVAGGLDLSGAGFLIKSNEVQVGKVFFIAEDGTAYESPFIHVPSSTKMSTSFPSYENMPTGIYQVRIEMYSQSYTLKYPVLVTEHVTYG